jgi:hypothetical protein
MLRSNIGFSTYMYSSAELCVFFVVSELTRFVSIPKPIARDQTVGVERSPTRA